MSTSSTKSDNPSTKDRVTRRQILQASAAGGISTSMTGCLGNNLLGTDSNPDKVRLGITVPISGSYGGVGENTRKGIELAVQHHNSNGNRDVEIAGKVDTKTDPKTARSKALELIQEDNIDLLVGNLSSSVAITLGQLCTQKGIMYIGGGGAKQISGEKCARNMFNPVDISTVQARGALNYILENDLGKSIYVIYLDYSWGQSHNQVIVNEIAPKNGLDVVNSRPVPLDANDYSSAITSARESKADIIYLGAPFSNQAAMLRAVGDYNVLNNQIVSSPAMSILSAKQVPQETLAHENAYFGATWYWQASNPEANKFSNAFNDEFEERPNSYAGSFYAGTRTLLKGVDEVSSTNDNDLVNYLEDQDMTPDIWGTNPYFRSCDHQATISPLTVKGLSPSKADKDNNKIFKVIDSPTGDLYPSCGERKCNL